MMSYKLAKPGDWVVRMIGAEQLKMSLRVTDVTKDRIVCGAWEFDRSNGAEVDEQLGWPRMENGALYTGSILSDAE